MATKINTSQDGSLWPKCFKASTYWWNITAEWRAWPAGSRSSLVFDIGCVLIRNCISLRPLGLHCQLHKLACHGTGVTHLYRLGDAIGGHYDDNIGEVADVAQFSSGIQLPPPPTCFLKAFSICLVELLTWQKRYQRMFEQCADVGVIYVTLRVVIRNVVRMKSGTIAWGVANMHEDPSPWPPV